MMLPSTGSLIVHMAALRELRSGGRTSTPAEWVIVGVLSSDVVVRRCSKKP